MKRIKSVVIAGKVHYIDNERERNGQQVTMCGKVVNNKATTPHLQLADCKTCSMAVVRKLDQRGRKLEKASKLNSTRLTLNNALYRLIAAQGERHDSTRDAGSYPFIPLGIEKQIRWMSKVKEELIGNKRYISQEKPVKFLDAGCGCGNAMLMAYATGLASECHGIEYSPEMADKAEVFLGTKNEKGWMFKVFREDIMAFKYYNKYDVLYYYCPFVDKRLQVRFEEYIEDKMKVGAILMCFLKQARSIRKDDRFKQVYGNSSTSDSLYVKIKRGKRKVSYIDRTDEQYKHCYGKENKLIEAKYNNITFS